MNNTITTNGNGKISVAFRIGYGDACAGGSEYDGYSFFVGTILDEYWRGFAAGKLDEPQMPAELDAEIRALVLAEVKRLAGGSEQRFEPFSDPALANVNSRMQGEPGYLESTQPWTF